jgi:hypothetical protein
MIKFPAVQKRVKDGCTYMQPSKDHPELWKKVVALLDKYGAVSIVVDKPMKPATDQQNRAFHALLSEFWQSGMSSYTTYDSLRATMKTVFLTQCFTEAEVCGKNSLEIKSWSDFTRKERARSIDCLIKECVQAGFNSKEIDLLGGV